MLAVDIGAAKREGEAHYAAKGTCDIRPSTLNALLRRKYCINAARKAIKDATPTAPPPPPSPPAPRCAACPLYVASAFEQAWTGASGSARGKICSVSASQLEGALAWLAYAAAAIGPGVAPPPTHAQQAVLSRFLVPGVRASAGAGTAIDVEYIEPLTGMARHPLAGIPGCIMHHISKQHLPEHLKAAYSHARPARPHQRTEHGVDVLNTSYLVLANRCGAGAESSRPRRSFLFDLGCSSRAIDAPPPPPLPPSPPPVSLEERKYEVRLAGEALFRDTGRCDVGIKYRRSKDKVWEQAYKRHWCVIASRKTTRAADANATGEGYAALYRRGAGGEALKRNHSQASQGEARAVRDGELQQMGSGNEPGIAVSSLGFFTSMYARNCIRFDGIYGWEAAPLAAGEWWRRVPISVASRVHLYNLPVKLATGNPTQHAAAEPADPDSTPISDPLATLVEVARPEDFVALKVDIDGGPEIDLVRRIAEEPELYERVDELFFEYRALHSIMMIHTHSGVRTTRHAFRLRNPRARCSP